MELEASPITPLPLPILSGHLLRQIVLTESLLICVFCLRRWLSTKSVWCSLLIFVTLLKISGQLTKIFQYAFVFSLFNQAEAIKFQRVFHSIHCDSGIFRQVTQKFLHKSQLLGIANNLVPTNGVSWKQALISH